MLQFEQHGRGCKVQSEKPLVTLQPSFSCSLGRAYKPYRSREEDFGPP